MNSGGGEWLHTDRLRRAALHAVVDRSTRIPGVVGERQIENEEEVQGLSGRNNYVEWMKRARELVKRYGRRALIAVLAIVAFLVGKASNNSWGWEPQLGSLGEWLSSLGTFAAIAVALWIGDHERKEQRREKNKQDQLEALLELDQLLHHISRAVELPNRLIGTARERLFDIHVFYTTAHVRATVLTSRLTDDGLARAARDALDAADDYFYEVTFTSGTGDRGTLDATLETTHDAIGIELHKYSADAH